MLPNLSDRTSEAAKELIRRGFRQVGLEVRRADPDEGADPPPLLDDPLEVLYHQRGGAWAAFRCPIGACTFLNGFHFAPGGWHPFVATVQEYLNGRSEGYEGSVLQRLHQAWQPANAAEAIAGFRHAPRRFADVPPFLFYATPWNSRSFDHVLRSIRSWYRSDNAEHGRPELRLERDGLPHFGPVSPEKGEIEWRRLARVADSMAGRGYDRHEGDVRVVMLRRGSDVRYLNNGGGYHRTAVARALGHGTIPAGFNQPWIIDVAEVELWPGVRSGLWTREQAVRFVDHLFDFDTSAWASERGLLDDPPPSASRVRRFG